MFEATIIKHKDGKHSTTTHRVFFHDFSAARAWLENQVDGDAVDWQVLPGTDSMYAHMEDEYTTTLMIDEVKMVIDPPTPLPFGAWAEPRGSYDDH